jgi:hypothetical protein
MIRSLLAATAVLALVTPVNAADLGGNCCADLEERIAELESTTARKGNRKVTLTISGQVNRAILFVDSDHGMIDNPNSPSRFTMMGEAKFSKDWSAGYLIEIGVGSAEDANVASGGLTGWAGPGLGVAGLGELVVRHNALWIGTPVGKVWLGHTSTATDGVVEITTANTNVAALPVGSWTGFDGARTQVLKYESAKFAGFTVSASWNDSLLSTTNGWDAALRYANEIGGFRLAAGIGHADNDAGTARTSGSASAMHMATGLFLTAQAGRMDGGAKMWGATGGIERNFFGPGATSLFLEAFQGDDVTATISPLGILGVGPIAELKVMGFGAVQNVSSLGLDVFATYRQVDVGTKADVFFVGARISY